jgi:hypothetical protein
MLRRTSLFKGLIPHKLSQEDGRARKMVQERTYSWILPSYSLLRNGSMVYLRIILTFLVSLFLKKQIVNTNIIAMSKIEWGEGEE